MLQQRWQYLRPFLQTQLHSLLRLIPCWRSRLQWRLQGALQHAAEQCCHQASVKALSSVCVSHCMLACRFSNTLLIEWPIKLLHYFLEEAAMKPF